MPPRRIASLLASSTEILYGLGLGEQVVAVSHECDWPPEAIGKPRVTRSHIDSTASSQAIDDEVRQAVETGQALYEIDIATLASLEPELIVTQAQCDVCAVKYQDVLDAVERTPSLRQSRVVALNPLTIGAVLEDVERVAEACGCPESGVRYRHLLQERINTVRHATRELSPAERPRVACIEWIEPLMIAANWMPELIDWAGGTQPFTRSGVHSGYHRWDELVAFNPQRIVVMPCGFDLHRTELEAQRRTEFPGWSRLSAVRDGQVFLVDGNAYFNRSGPRLVDSLEILARLTHPRRFGLRGDESCEAGMWVRYN